MVECLSDRSLILDLKMEEIVQGKHGKDTGNLCTETVSAKRSAKERECRLRKKRQRNPKGRIRRVAVRTTRELKHLLFLSMKEGMPDTWIGYGHSVSRISLNSRHHSSDAVKLYFVRSSYVIFYYYIYEFSRNSVLIYRVLLVFAAFDINLHRKVATVI